MPQSSPHLTDRHFVVGPLLGVGCFNAVYEVQLDESALRSSDLDPAEFGTRGARYALKKPKKNPPALRRRSSADARQRSSRRSALAALRRRSSSADARRRSSGGGGSVASTSRRGSSSSSSSVLFNVSRRDSAASLDDDAEQEEDEAELMRLTAVADLERECDLMSDLDHPNVVRLHWILPGEMKQGGTMEGPMLVLDRLRYNLAEKISQWRWAYREGRADADETDMDQGGEQQGCGGRAMTKMRRRRSSLGEVIASKKSVRKRTAGAFLSERLGAALDVAEGMQYLHGRGIAHRDLKPDNIGFDANGRAKIFDFGLAKRLVEPAAAEDDGSDSDDADSDSSQSSSLQRPDCTPKRHSGCVGTLRYMAPEVARSDEYALDADIYSFGMLLYEICSLERPYGNIGRTDLSRKVHHHHRTGGDVGVGANKRKGRRMSWVGGIGGRRSSLGGGGGDKFAARRETNGGSYRPKLPSAWPSDVRELMSRCWSDKPEERPEWDEIINVLRVEHESGKERACSADKERSSSRKGGRSSSRPTFGRRRASFADLCSSHTVASSSMGSEEGSGRRGRFGFSGRRRLRRSSCGDEADDVLPSLQHGCDPGRQVGGDGSRSSGRKGQKAVLYDRRQKEDPRQKELMPSFEASNFPATPLPEIPQEGVRNRLTRAGSCAA